MGGIFGRAMDPHQPLMKGEEKTSDGAGLAIEYQGTVLPFGATDVYKKTFPWDRTSEGVWVQDGFCPCCSSPVVSSFLGINVFSS